MGTGAARGHCVVAPRRAARASSWEPPWELPRLVCEALLGKAGSWPRTSLPLDV